MRNMATLNEADTKILYDKLQSELSRGDTNMHSLKERISIAEEQIAEICDKGNES
jgi:hypothetical protein